MKLLMTAAATAALAVCATTATAATFDFDQLGEDFQESQNYEGTFDQVADWDDDGSVNGSTTALEDGGISVTAEAYTFDGDAGTDADPFFDSISGGRLAGLGVCSSGDSPTAGPGDVTVSACSTGYDPVSANGDDNLNMTETLILSFSTDVMLEELYVRDAQHYFLSAEAGDGIMISTDGWSFSTYTAQDENGSIDLAGLGASSIYFFSATEQAQAYISTVVASAVPQIPLPAGVWLMMGALGGLGAAARRKRV